MRLAPVSSTYWGLPWIEPRARVTRRPSLSLIITEGECAQLPLGSIVVNNSHMVYWYVGESARFLLLHHHRSSPGRGKGRPSSVPLLLLCSALNRWVGDSDVTMVPTTTFYSCLDRGRVPLRSQSPTVYTHSGCGRRPWLGSMGGVENNTTESE